MFTGIIEGKGQIGKIVQKDDNVIFTINSELSDLLKIDQSVSHNGVCLTVIRQDKTSYDVEAIKETLDKSHLGTLNEGDYVNLERAMVFGDRLDGHIVQGHVDQTTTCTGVLDLDGSWRFSFKLPEENKALLVPKGSICINGVSLTVSRLTDEEFTVDIIPFTYEHTGFGRMAAGDQVNLEFDVIGKYVARLVAPYQ